MSRPHANPADAARFLDAHRETCRAAGHHRLSVLRRRLRADLLRMAHESSDPGADRISWRRSLSLLLTPPGMATLLHRISHFLWARRWRTLTRLVLWTNHLVHRVAITPESCIGGGLFLPHPAGVVFHGRAGRNLGLYTDAICGSYPLSPSASLEEAPVFEDGVLVGIHVSVLGAVRIGQGANLPFKLTVIDDVPTGSVVASRAMQHRTVGPPERISTQADS